MTDDQVGTTDRRRRPAVRISSFRPAVPSRSPARTMAAMRIFVVANPDKADVRPTLGKWLPLMGDRVDVVGVDYSCEDDLGGVDADVILVMGG